MQGPIGLRPIGVSFSDFLLVFPNDLCTNAVVLVHFVPFLCPNIVFLVFVIYFVFRPDPAYGTSYPHEKRYHAMGSFGLQGPIAWDLI